MAYAKKLQKLLLLYTDCFQVSEHYSFAADDVTYYSFEVVVADDVKIKTEEFESKKGSYVRCVELIEQFYEKQSF